MGGKKLVIFHLHHRVAVRPQHLLRGPSPQKKKKQSVNVIWGNNPFLL
jgi:hypothetical protein